MSTFYTGNRYLSQEEMEANAEYIWNYLGSRGWSIYAVCGMLGNMETESTINPGIWEGLDEGDTSQGYGLVQWTPATKYLEWCSENGLEPSHMDSALERIIWELENGEQFYPTDAYPMTFQEFKTSTETAGYLAMVFLANYERPQDPDQPARGSQAAAWYSLLAGTDPDVPTSPDTGDRQPRSLPLIYKYIATRRRF